VARSKFSDKLRTLGAAIKRDVAKEMFAAGDIVAADAHLSITTGTSSGRKTKKHLHVASAPGEAPNNDQGGLVSGIKVLQVEPLRVLIVSTAPYSKNLEYGTSKMAARPFMGPAADRTRKEVTQQLRTAAGRAARRHFKD
jgi:HK97 gp10 family phage protein